MANGWQIASKSVANGWQIGGKPLANGKRSKEKGVRRLDKGDRRINRAKEIALLYLDYVLETYSTPDYVEVLGVMGGDPVKYRIYDDGRIYER